MNKPATWRPKLAALGLRILRFPLRAVLGVEPLWVVIVFGGFLLFGLYKLMLLGVVELWTLSPRPPYALPAAYAAVALFGVAIAWLAISLWTTPGGAGLVAKVAARTIAGLLALSVVFGIPGVIQVVERNFATSVVLPEIERRTKATAPNLDLSNSNLFKRTPDGRFHRYVEEWKAKIERVGNDHYPPEARGRLYGSLRMSVSINPDGTVSQTRIGRSSGSDVLDRAALRIVELASPFAPFPPEIRRDTDILVITRTWTFGPTDRLDTQ